MKWTLNGQPDRKRTALYITAVVTALLYYVLAFVDTIVSEKGTSVQMSYVVLYLFMNAAWYITYIAFLALALRTTRQYSQRGSPSQKIANTKEEVLVRTTSSVPLIVSRVFIVLYSLLSIAAWTLYAAYIGIALNLVNNSGPISIYYKTIGNMRKVILASLCLYLLATIWILVESVMIVVKQKSRVSFAPLPF
jgi:hypothetical protein